MTPADQHLLPGDAVKRAPASVRKAQAEAERLRERAAATKQLVINSRKALDAARGIDAEAAIEAVAADKAPPEPTEPKRRQELDTATEARRISNEEARAGVVQLHRAIHAHRRAMLATEASAIEERRERMRKALDTLAEEGKALAAEAGVLAGLRSIDEYSDSRARGKLLQNIGRARFSVPSGATEIAAAISSARQAVDGIDASTETAGDAKDREKAEADQARNAYAQSAGARGGGVAVH